MTTLHEEGTGKPIQFDIALQHREQSRPGQKLTLELETKASTNRDFVNGGFQDFLRRVARVILPATEVPGQNYHFGFVAPILPKIVAGPLTLDSVPELQGLFTGAEPVPSLKHLDKMAGRTVVYTLAAMNDLILGLED